MQIILEINESILDRMNITVLKLLYMFFLTVEKLKYSNMCKWAHVFIILFIRSTSLYTLYFFQGTIKLQQ